MLGSIFILCIRPIDLFLVWSQEKQNTNSVESIFKYIQSEAWWREILKRSYFQNRYVTVILWQHTRSGTSNLTEAVSRVNCKHTFLTRWNVFMCLYADREHCRQPWIHKSAATWSIITEIPSLADLLWSSQKYFIHLITIETTKHSNDFQQITLFELCLVKGGEDKRGSIVGIGRHWI